MESKEFEYLIKLKEAVSEKYKPGVKNEKWTTSDCKTLAIEIEVETNCPISYKTLQRFDNIKESDSIKNNKAIQILSMFALNEKIENTSVTVQPIYFSKFIRTLDLTVNPIGNKSIRALEFPAIINYACLLKYQNNIYSENITINYPKREIHLESTFFRMNFIGKFTIKSGYLYIETWGKEKFKEDKRLDIWIYKGRNTITQELDILEGIFISSKNTGFPIYGEILLVKKEILETLSRKDLDQLTATLNSTIEKKSFGKFNFQNLNYLD